ncbi:Cyclin-D2-1 [Zea mays]|uniref:Cyclin-D2-1 n=1 Tax=Zea mays TaxID=4577 RepID=A0A1D6NSN0_MAIZE|nr:Cyclin-D2-1 [Zea mays]
MRKPASTDAATLSSHPLTLRRLARLLALLARPPRPCGSLLPISRRGLHISRSLSLLPAACSVDLVREADADQQPWMPQLLFVACLTIAAKMEETVVLRRLDIHQNQVPSEKYSFDLDAIQRMEIYVLDSLNWRMQVVTPFSYINYFVDKFTGGKPLSCGFISRRTEIVLGSLEATKLLQFRPFEMAAVVLSAAAESQVIAFSGALLASNIPVNKENVRICHEALQEVGLVKKKTDYTASPSRVLDASCFSFKTDDNQTAGSALTVLFASDIRQASI